MARHKATRNTPPSPPATVVTGMDRAQSVEKRRTHIHR